MQKRSLETRQRILSSALECFALHGFNATGVAEICSTASVSKGAFYHHFPSKQAVFLALLQDWLQNIDNQLEASRQRGSLIPQVLQSMSELMSTVFAQARGHLPMFLEFWAQANRDVQVWQTLIDPYRRYQDYFSILIQQGISEGSFKPVDPDLAARMLVSIALGLLLQSLLDPQGAEWDQVSRQSISFFLSGLSK